MSPQPCQRRYDNRVSGLQHHRRQRQVKASASASLPQVLTEMKVQQESTCSSEVMSGRQTFAEYYRSWTQRA